MNPLPGGKEVWGINSDIESRNSRIFKERNNNTMSDFLFELNKNNNPNPNHNVFDELWSEYERVIVHSLITTFGLDFLIVDQDGGDVDTINTVNKTLSFKNKKYSKRYDDRGIYNEAEYHSAPNYRSVIHEAREKYQNEGFNRIQDSYDPNNRLYFLTASGANTWKKANLDHVIAAKEIHDDPARILANIDGLSLANDPNNLRFTSEALNKKMGNKSISEFIDWCDENPDKVNWGGVDGKGLPDDVRKQLIKEDEEARKHYNATLEKAYYSSPDFYADLASAATTVGIEMGLRQVTGMVFLEIYMECKRELSSIPSDCDIDHCFGAIEKGIKTGIDKSKSNYKELFKQFGEGFAAGFFSSITTTLLNIFGYTKKNTIKYVRYGLTAAVQATNVLLINPDDLLLGDQFITAGIIMATGASNIVGSYVGDTLKETPVGKLPHVGTYVCTFTSLLVSGLTSCTVLIAADRSKFIRNVIHNMNQYRTDYQITKEYSSKLIQLSAELSELDINDFEEKTNTYLTVSKMIFQNPSEEEMESMLTHYFKANNITIPWGDDFDRFMEDEEAVLHF